jgi:hypothetical protein
MNFKKKSTFVGHFCPPGSGSTDPIESGSNPDPQPCFQETFTARMEQLLASLADHEGVHAAGCAQLADRITGGLAQNVAALGRLAGLMDQLGAAGGAALTAIEDSVRTHGLEATR